VVWNQGSPGPDFSLNPSGRRITSIKFQPGQSRLAVGYDDGMVEVWDTRNNEMIWKVKAHGQEVTGIRFNGLRQRMATAGRDGTLRLWETTRPDELPVSFSDNGGPVVAIEFSSDGNLIISGTGSEKENLKARPVETDLLAGDFPSKITRNFTRGEWIAFVGNDIDYEQTVSRADFDILIKELK